MLSTTYIIIKFNLKYLKTNGVYGSVLTSTINLLVLIFIVHLLKDINSL